MENITKNENLPLFETMQAKGRFLHRLYFGSMSVGIAMILAYRWIHIPEAKEAKMERWACYGMLAAELWFAFYWILSQIVRWMPRHNFTFKDRLLTRYGKMLPQVDVFVCTADAAIEPPMLVINTILSVMAYDYPADKLSVYLSDDGGSELTFYALLQAAEFAKHWIPYCNMNGVMSRSPAAFFSAASKTHGADHMVDIQHFTAIKELYIQMKERVDRVVELGRVPEEIRVTHKGFKEWCSFGISRSNHQTILEILIDSEEAGSTDVNGSRLPTLVYLAREKRPHHPHHFKAGALNALIRVSSQISNAPIILNLDCDMYSNDPETIKDAVCFFMDERAGDELAYVQMPQCFTGLTKNDLYGASLTVIMEMELQGFNYLLGPPYIGTCCFHRRESLCGKPYNQEFKADWTNKLQGRIELCARELEERAKRQANCGIEQSTGWGKEMGLKYGCLVEDIATGLAIQCRGWRSVTYHPRRPGFWGLAPSTLLSSLNQYKRWGEGHLDILFSANCSFLQGFRKIPLAHQLAYCIYNLWPVNSIPEVYYVLIPPLCLLKGLPLYPKVSSQWFLPFAYVIVAQYTYSLCESISCGVTVKAWWNLQRMTLYRRTAAFLFSVINAILKAVGIGESVFVVTAKGGDDDGVARRYEQEIMEFGSDSSMFTWLSTLALVSFICLAGALTKVAMGKENYSAESLALQFFLSGSLVAINWPIYEALFFRKDEGKLPKSVLIKSLALSMAICSGFIN